MNNKKKLSPENALSRAAMLCSRCEQAEFDIRNKLKTWGVDKFHTEEIINRLIDEKYLDNQRYAKAFARDKFRFDGWGMMKIAFNLRRKDFPQHVIDLALDEIDTEEYEQMLYRILNQKLHSLKGKEPLLIKAGLVRFAASRGFEPDLIYRMISKLPCPDNDY